MALILSRNSFVPTIVVPLYVKSSGLPSPPGTNFTPAFFRYGIAASPLPARDRRPSQVTVRLARKPGRLRQTVPKRGNTSGTGACYLRSTRPRRQPSSTEKTWRPTHHRRPTVLRGARHSEDPQRLQILAPDFD